MLRNAHGGEGCQIFRKKALRRCKVQCYLRYEGVGGVQFPEKKRYVTLEFGERFREYNGVIWITC